MRSCRLVISLLILTLWSPAALAFNVKVREVRRERLEGAVTLVYEVENGSVDRVRFHQVEAHVFDGNGRRVALQRPFLDLNPMRPGDVAFLQVRLGPEIGPLAGELLLKFLASRDLSFPVLEPRQPQRLEFRFPLRRELREIGDPKQVPRLKLQPIGFLERSNHPSRFLVYRLTNEGPGVIHGILELRYLGRGHPFPFTRHVILHHLLAGQERMIQVEIPKDMVHFLGGLEARVILLDGVDNPEPPPDGDFRRPPSVPGLVCAKGFSLRLHPEGVRG